MAEQITFGFAGRTYQLQVPDGMTQTITDAFCETLGYQAEVPNPDWTDDSQTPRMIPNPVTRDQFVAHKIREYVESVVKAHKLQLARQQAEQMVQQEVEVASGRVVVSEA